MSNIPKMMWKLAQYYIKNTEFIACIIYFGNIGNGGECKLMKEMAAVTHSFINTSFRAHHYFTQDKINKNVLLSSCNIHDLFSCLLHQ